MTEFNWYFRPINSNFPERTPKEEEFFREGDVCENLVRESVQNAIDAKRDDSETVKVRLTFDELKKDEFDVYTSHLEPHLKGCDIGVRPFNRHKQRILTVEDFGTTGLTGKTSISQLTDEEKKTKNYGNFIGFWRKEGESGKGGTSLGRWGLGKTTYHMSSQIRAFWGLTVRNNEQKEQMLLGKTVLEPHDAIIDSEEQRWDYAGIYGDKDLNPIEDQEFLEGFKNTFNVSRADDEPGFSVILPCVDRKIRHSRVVRDAIRNYFYAIASGDLVIEVIDKKDDSSKVVLNQENLRDVAANQVDWDESNRDVEDSWQDRDVDELMAFVERIAHRDVKKMVDFSDSLNGTKWGEEAFGDDLEEIKELYNEGFLLGFKIPVTIRPDGEPTIDTSFKVFLKKYPDRPKMLSDEFYIRSGIYLPKEKKRLGRRAVRGFLVAEEEDITNFLGDAEVPSHNKWKNNVGDFPDKYNKHAKTLAFIRNSHKHIAQLLEKKDDTVFENLLKDILSIEDAPEFEDEDQDDEGKTEDDEEDEVPEEPNRQTLSTDQVPSGFQVSFVGEKEDLPISAVIKCAYEISRGDAFSNYNEFDFDFENDDIGITTKNADIDEKGNNRLEITLKDEESHVKFEGFDENRELVTRVRKKYD